MSRWLDIARVTSPELFSGSNALDSTSTMATIVPRANSANSAISPLLALTAQTAQGTERPKTVDQAHSASVVCIFCGNLVNIGTPGTGALAGEPLHMDCYRQRFFNGHLPEQGR